MECLRICLGRGHSHYIVSYLLTAYRAILCLCFLAVLGAGALRSVRLAQAQALYASGSADSLGEAEQILPGCALYPKARGLLLSQEMGRPDEADVLFRRALSLNPRDAGLRIELGLQDEASGDLASAEQKLLHAASLDNTFHPRWSLANFYFRRNQRDKFLIWAKRSAEMAHGNLTPLFKLSLRMTGDSSIVLNRVIAARSEIIAPYLQFTLDENRLADAVPVARALLRTSGVEHADGLTLFCDRLLGEYPKDRRSLGAAIEIWNSLIEHRAMPLRRVEGGSVINADFSYPPRSHGFDWRINWLPPVHSSFSPSGGSVSFSGKQPEACDILYQLIPVDGETRYQFSVSYKTTSVAARSGLSWRVLDEGDGSELVQTQYLQSEEWRDEAVPFTTARDTRLLRLVLSYRRLPGTTRTEGTLLFKNISLRMAE
jgi:tetratricopeptide (TPR) repeat protein